MALCWKMADWIVLREKLVISPGNVSDSKRTLPRIYKKKSFSRHKTTLWDLLSAATLLVRVGQASHRSSRTVRRRVIPGTFRQPERQLSKGYHKSPQAFQIRIDSCASSG